MLIQCLFPHFGFFPGHIYIVKIVCNSVEAGSVFVVICSFEAKILLFTFLVAVEQLHLQLCFINFNNGRKVTLTLDLTCLNRYGPI